MIYPLDYALSPYHQEHQGGSPSCLVSGYGIVFVVCTLSLALSFVCPLSAMHGGKAHVFTREHMTHGYTLFYATHQGKVSSCLLDKVPALPCAVDHG